MVSSLRTAGLRRAAGLKGRIRDGWSPVLRQFGGKEGLSFKAVYPFDSLRRKNVDRPEKRELLRKERVLSYHPAQQRWLPDRDG